MEKIDYWFYFNIDYLETNTNDFFLKILLLLIQSRITPEKRGPGFGKILVESVVYKNINNENMFL